MTDTAARAFGEASMVAVNVKDMGAVGNGNVDDSAAIQHALNGRGTVVIPVGNYLIGRTLRIGSGTRLIVHPQATLRFADDAGQVWNDFLLANADPDGGDTDIEIGGGIWCGNNINNPRGSKLIDPGKYGGVMLNFYNVRNLTFSDAVFCDAQSYYFRLSRVTGFLVQHIDFHTQHPMNNNDGIHLGGNCYDGVIRYLRGLGRGAPNDDMVAMNADDVLQRVECYGQDCGPIRNVRVTDISADDCHTFVRLLSVDSPIEDIDIDGVRGGCQVTTLNMDGARGCRVPMFDPEDPQYARGVGLVRNVRLRDVQVYKSGPWPSALVNLQQRVDNLCIDNFTRITERDACPAAPTILAKYLPDQRVTLEGLSSEQVAAIQEKSSAETKVMAMPDGSEFLGQSVTAQVAWGTELSLPAGGFRRFTVNAGADGVPKA